jgi:hypothetical protein
MIVEPAWGQVVRHRPFTVQYTVQAERWTKRWHTRVFIRYDDSEYETELDVRAKHRRRSTALMHGLELALKDAARSHIHPASIRVVVWP